MPLPAYSVILRTMSFLLHLLFTIANWIPVALVYTFILGRGRTMNWGPVGMSIVAAYGIYVPLYHGASYPVALLCGLACALLISGFYSWLALRLGKDDAFGVLSIAVHLAILTIVLNWPGVTRAALGIPGIRRIPGLETQEALTVACIVAALLWIGAMFWIDRSRFGRQVTAYGEQDVYAASIGIHKPRLVFAMFALLGIAVWMDNIFYAQYLHLLHPNDYQFPAFIFLLTIVVAGRPGSLWGTIAATASLVLLRELLRYVPLPIPILGPVRLILFGLILLVAVWVQREKLFPKQRSI